MRRVWILAPAVLLLAACGGSSNKSGAPSSSSGSPQQTISLSEKEFSITPKTISVSKAGSYTFDVKNNGQITHALVVEGNGAEQKTGDIQAGGSTTLTVNLKKGSYEVYCPIDGHRQNGMQASLAVGGSAGGGMTTGNTSTGGTTTNKGGYGY